MARVCLNRSGRATLCRQRDGDGVFMYLVNPMGWEGALYYRGTALASEGCRQKQRCQNALLRTSPLLSGGCIAVEGSHGNEGLLLGRPPEEPDQPITENSLLEVLDGIVMMYNLSVHQQLGKVSRNPFPQPPCFYTDFLFSAYLVTLCAVSFSS